LSLRKLGFGINPRGAKEAFDLIAFVTEEDEGFVAFGNPSGTWYVCCGEDRGRQYCTLGGCKCRCQGGLIGVYASLLKIFGGVTSFGWE
jgi:hypothetical protein